MQERKYSISSTESQMSVIQAMASHFTELSWKNKLQLQSYKYDKMFSSLLQCVITENLPECLFYSNVQKGISSLTDSLQFLPKMCEMEENLHSDLFFSCWNIK